jgi:hypothetical protein
LSERFLVAEGINHKVESTCFKQGIPTDKKNAGQKTRHLKGFDESNPYKLLPADQVSH